MKTEDIKKIYYFLLSTNPINKKNLKHQLKFPYKIREFLWIWNVLNEILSKPTKDYNDKKVTSMTNLSEMVPDIKISVNQIFGIYTEMKIDGFS